MNGGGDDAPVVPGLRPHARFVLRRIYARIEPVAVMTLLRTAWRVERALHFLDRIRDALGIEEDDDFFQA
jgi:hypothetical protein